MLKLEPFHFPEFLTPRSLLKNFSDRELRTLALFSILFILILLAWVNRFVQDDAFISFRYADNLVQGKGLIWNEGEKVEGYTNFLWTLLMSIPLAFGKDVIEFSYIVGITLFTVNILLTYQVSNLIFPSPSLSLLVVFLLGTNYTFSSYATGGLETSLQTTALLAGIFLTCRHGTMGPWKAKDLFLLSIIFSVALLTRLDSSIFLIPMIVVLLIGIFKQSQPLRNKLLHTALLAVPAFIIVGAWLGWKWTYYGDVLPNTFYVKLGAGNPILYGIIFLYSFLFSYWLIPLFALLMVFSRKLIFSNQWVCSLLASIVTLWLFYILKIGGGFMEFRFLVPILPFLFIFFVWLIMNAFNQTTLRMVFVILILVGSLHHALTFNRLTSFHNIAGFSRLQGRIYNQDENWSGIGKTLGEVFKANLSQVLIATTAAGAIPYYSRLPTIDQHGLNDKWVAHNGTTYGDRPGHQKIATLDYLVQRGVNIVVGHPKVIEAGLAREKSFILEDLISFRISGISPRALPPDTKLVEIPLDYQYSVLVLYLLPTPQIDQVIRENRFQIYPISRTCDPRHIETIYARPAVLPTCDEV